MQILPSLIQQVQLQPEVHPKTVKNTKLDMNTRTTMSNIFPRYEQLSTDVNLKEFIFAILTLICKNFFRKIGQSQKLSLHVEFICIVVTRFLISIVLFWLICEISEKYFEILTSVPLRLFS